MTSSDWSVYESKNYDGVIVPSLKPKQGIPGVPKPSWVKRWMNEGMRRTVKAVFVTHTDGIPHFVIINMKTQFGIVPFLFGGKLLEGESEQEGLIRHLRSFVLKAKASDECEWKVGETIAKFHRPEFDERVYPYIPAHVTRPKEEITLLQVVLPPKCVFAIREGWTVSAVPVHEIVRAGENYPALIRCLPSLLSRFTVYSYVPGRAGFAPLFSNNRRQNPS